MKKRSLFALCLIALASIAVLVSCFMQDPILDNKAIGNWIAKDSTGDTLTLEVKSDQTFKMVLKQNTTGPTTLSEILSQSTDSAEIDMTGKWTASSISEGSMIIDYFETQFTFTAYDNELVLYNPQEKLSITFNKV